MAHTVVVYSTDDAHTQEFHDFVEVDIAVARASSTETVEDAHAQGLRDAVLGLHSCCHGKKTSIQTKDDLMTLSD